MTQQRGNSGSAFFIIILLFVSLFLYATFMYSNDLSEDETITTEDLIEDLPDSDNSTESDSGDSSSGGSNGGGGSSSRESYFGVEPDLIHLVLGDDPDASITIIWVTGDGGEDDNYVKYHKEGVGANTTATGENIRLSGTTDYVHVVDITSLDVDSVYYFYCGSDDNGYSVERKFKTTGTALGNFTVITDTQSLGEEFENVSILMAAENPEFVLHCGDHVSNSDDMNDWIEYFNIIEETWITSEGLTIPIIPILGNHDDSSGWFWDFFDLTREAEWCSYEWSNNIIVALNSVDDDLIDDQNTFLTNAVNVTKNVTVGFHHNIYESPIKSEQDEIVTNWIPIFEEYDTSIVIHGHEHRYYRSNKTNGVTYMCAGAGGGSPRDELPPDFLDIDHYEAAYCYVLFDVTGNMLYATDIDDVTFDSHVIIE